MDRIAEVLFNLELLTEAHMPAIKELFAQPVRFVLFQEEKDGFLLIASGRRGETSHATWTSRFLQDWPNAQLVAGGYFSKKNLWYDSETCLEQYGYDCPADPKERERLKEIMCAVLREKGIIPAAT